jgi:branched-chain amino acid aminotransferase
MPEPLAYLNGRISPISQAALHVFDLGVAMGATVTEMTRTFRLEPFRLEEHLARLFRSIRYVGISMDHTPESIADLARELVDHNGRLIPRGHDLGLTMFVTAGTSLTYTGLADGDAHHKPSVCLHTFPLPYELYAPRLSRGLHLVTPATRQLPADCLDPRIKCRSRLHWYLADQQAREVDPQAQALLLDQRGYVTETSTSNVVAVFGKRIVTPREAGVLAGISLQAVRELSRSLGYDWSEADLTPFDLVNADECLATSTPTCLLPVTRINGKPVGSGVPGEAFGRLLAAWSDAVGLDIAEQIVVGAEERLEQGRNRNNG